MHKYFLVSLIMTLTGAAQAAPWLSDYKTALKQAKSEDKPIFVYFSDEPAQALKEKFNGQDSLLDQFVLLKADKATAQGQKLYKAFEIDGPRASVVIERDLDWQFCRYLRDLSKDEIRRVLKATTSAKGLPQVDVLAVSAREETITPTSSGSPAQPATSSETFVYPSSGSYCPNCRR